LQKLEAPELYIDRIIDPLLFIARNNTSAAKAYVGGIPQDCSMFFPGFQLRPKRGLLAGKQETVMSRVRSMAGQAGVLPESLGVRFSSALNSFYGWYMAGNELFASMPNLKHLYLVSWYFPDMMGLTAAAKDAGVTVTDVQHGKQGRYQGMYSWWTRIPSGGYQMMPDRFWCWGQPSCDDILGASPDRVTHRPFVGGFPWIDWYRTFINPASVGRTSGKIILFTLQGPQGENKEPIPEFIVDFLKDARYSDWRIRFRNHPNFSDGLDYCSKRLSSVDGRRFETSDGSRNLYDELLECSHHITAYSSCGYEAECFGVPTLLFGEEARRIYETDIASGRFTWTAGKLDEFTAWLDRAGTASKRGPSRPYIESSLSLASVIFSSDLNGMKEGRASVSGDSPGSFRN
jgi:hypothetical protein